MTEAVKPIRILLVEDDAKLSALVREFLETSHYEVLQEVRGDTATARILGENPDLVILDIMLPGKDGITVCREVRPQYAGPILMLTALNEETDEVVGLEVGADDYLTKPVSPRLLLTRIHALLRRSTFAVTPPQPSAETADKGNRIMMGSLVIDAGNREVLLDGVPVELTTSEFDLLHYLAEHPGEVLTRERIYKDVRGIDYDGSDRSIDLRIMRLRKKLGDDAKQSKRIKSIHGTGYLFAEDQ